MEIKFKTFYEAWWYLQETPVFCLTEEQLDILDIPRDLQQEFNYFTQGLDIDVVKVNPKTGEIDDNPELNTKTEVWLECGEPFISDGQFGREGEVYCYHNIDYDCGGNTFEEAIINLANIVWHKNRI